MEENILDSFVLNDRQANLLDVNGTLIMQWYNESGYKQRGLVLRDISSGSTQIALASSKGESRIGFNELNGQFITTGILIPKSVNNSFMTINTLILFASRYSVEVPLELDKWVTLEINNFTSDICRTFISRTTTSTTTPFTSIPEIEVLSTVETTIPTVGISVTTTPTTVSTTTLSTQTNNTEQNNPLNETNILNIFFPHSIGYNCGFGFVGNNSFHHLLHER